MTETQAKWLADHPAFKAWRPPNMVVSTWWADVSWLCPSGRLIPDGGMPGFGKGTLISAGDTLYVLPKGSIKVGREVPAT